MRFQLLVAILLNVLTFNRSYSEPIDLIFGHVGDENSIHDMTAREFARRVGARLNGRVRITVTGGSALGNDIELEKKVLDGSVTFFLPSVTFDKVDPVFSVWSLPYLVLGRDIIRNSRARLLNEYFRPAAEAKGFHLLALWENGFRHVTNNVKPIVFPSDLRDVRIRVGQGSSTRTIFEAYGAKVIEWPYGQALYDALKDGRIDGQENPFGNIYTARYHEVQKYLSLTAHQYLPLYVVTSKKTWDALPPADREEVEKIAEELQDWAMDLGEKLDNFYLEELRSRIAINKIETLAFVIASIPIYQKFAARVPHGKELISLLYDKTSLAVADRRW
jgi:tripartite ATP-independent transporter DctP family solute receptor